MVIELRNLKIERYFDSSTVELYYWKVRIRVGLDFKAIYRKCVQGKSLEQRDAYITVYRNRLKYLLK